MMAQNPQYRDSLSGQLTTQLASLQGNTQAQVNRNDKAANDVPTKYVDQMLKQNTQYRGSLAGQLTTLRDCRCRRLPALTWSSMICSSCSRETLPWPLWVCFLNFAAKMLVV